MKVLIVVLTVIIAFAVIAIYDARKIASKYFSKQDQNKVALTLKLIGFIVMAICGIVILMIK